MSVAVIITSPAICIDEPTDASHWFAQGRTHANMNIPADPHFRTVEARRDGSAAWVSRLMGGPSESAQYSRK